LPILDFGEEDRRPFFVTPHLTGGNLSTRLGTGSFSLDQTIEVFTPIAEALDYSADQGLIHHNIKPNNILFDDHNNPYIAELGVIQILGELTAARIPTANPHYANPEQARRLKPDKRSQVYSLAAVIYQVLSGQTVFHGATEMIALFKHTSDRVHPPSEVNPALSESVDDVLITALAKHPEERYPGAVEFIRVLKVARTEVIPPDGLAQFYTEFDQDESAPPIHDEPSDEPVPSAPSPEADRTRSIATLIIILATGLCVLCGFATFFGSFLIPQLAPSEEDSSAYVMPTEMAAKVEAAKESIATAADWPLLIDETFDDNSLGWHEGQIEDEYASMILTIDGQYTWQVTALQGFTWRVWPTSDMLGDFYLSVDVKEDSDNPNAEYGLIFRNNDGNFFYFEVRETGEYQVLSMADDNWNTVLPMTYSEYIRPGEFNRLIVIAHQETFIFMVNGQYLGQVSAGPPDEGQPGVSIGLPSAGEQSIVVFDNFQVRTPPTTNTPEAAPDK
jgi:hypothetical protein